MFIHLARLSHETNDVVSFQKSLDFHEVEKICQCC